MIRAYATEETQTTKSTKKRENVKSLRKGTPSRVTEGAVPTTGEKQKTQKINLHQTSLPALSHPTFGWNCLFLYLLSCEYGWDLIWRLIGAHRLLCLALGQRTG